MFNLNFEFAQFVNSMTEILPQNQVFGLRALCSKVEKFASESAQTVNEVRPELKALNSIKEENCLNGL